ncbi:conjugative relaxase-like TrwC/TraI family protein [Actinomycetospora succinea]|uniref:Conjugative relaxase-like TrwC/TraI family protein n=1 Tax=Actinomycetospora succinea TaxID=663603 RepID=A0A4R6VMW5_9PSEU|nr:MobF family relaxase [Actinomycetospora succinea]TDQ65182.1 conjugative relaxase-like TrwC/TraI family protein [Actinomycetospora succinea]
MLSVATGYNPDYLLKEVATGRENYYTGAVAEGEPPGRWWGAGAESLGLMGEVDAQDMTAIYSRFLDPRAEGFRDPSRWDELGETATLGHAGRAYKSAEQLYAVALEREPDASAKRRDELRVEASKAVRQNVAFLDLTFSVQKSVTLLHTAFEAEEVKAREAGLDDEAAEWGRMRETVERAIWRGNEAALSYLQEHAGYARVGHHGGTAGRWVDAQNWVVASFFQHDSRDHDPQLHIHNATLNRQQADDGQWRTLDSRAVHRLKPAAAAVGERTTDESLIQDLGVAMAMRPDGLTREATAVDPASRDRFSTRSHNISGRAAELIEAFEAAKGREATGLERDRIKRQATLDTRSAKSHGGETREAFLARVDGELRAEVAGGLAGIAHAARTQGSQDRAAPERFSAAEVIEAALEAMQEKKTSFTHADLVREINALLPDHLGTPEGTDVARLLRGLADQGIALVEQVEAPTPGEGLEPDALRRRDGTSVYSAPGGRSYVTREHLRSENRLRAATRAADGVRLTPSQAQRFVEHLRDEGIELGVDQAAAVAGILTSGARLETLIGPAGTGKSFVVGSLARAWTDPTHRRPEEPDRRVFGLATAQVAADVLTAEGLTAANTQRWLAAQRRLDSAAATHRPARDTDEPWRLREGDLLVVDESSMADTASLAAVHAYAQEASAKILLVGDPRQLGAVGAGGAMDLVANAGARYELADARRFTHDWERDASLRLRAGDPEVIRDYHRHGRLLDAGSLADAEASAAHSWLADTLAGHRSLLVVDTNDAAARVSSSIRDELVRLGRVEEQGVPLRDGTYAGVGDVVQGRRVAWELAGYEGNRRGAVNREHYRVLGVRDDGALDVAVVPPGAPFHPRPDDVADHDRRGRSESEGERLVLPTEYVTTDLTLSYASTVHATEGATVWSSHPVVTPHTDLNALYVGLSRGREANTAHVATLSSPDDAAQGSESDQVHRDPRAVLAAILDTREAVDEANQSATAAREDAAARAASVQTAGERFADVAHEASVERTSRWLDGLVAQEVLAPHDRQRVAAEDGTAGLTRLLRQAEIAGNDPSEVLRGAVEDRPLEGARRVSDVIQGRIRAEHTFEPNRDSWFDWVPNDVDEPTRRYLEVLAAAADTRARDLGSQLAEQPPVWALSALGPVPHDAPDREVWTARAGTIAAHRELSGHSLDGDEASYVRGGDQGVREASAADVLGSAPPRGHVEAHAAYRAAHRAAGLPDHQRDELECSPAGHRVRVRAWEREQAWGPVYVENLLAGTRQAEARHRQTAELRRAEADAAPDDASDKDRLAREADHADALADSLDRHGASLEEQSQTYAQWYAATAMTRALAEASTQYLAEQHAADEPEPAVTADEWLALDRAARHEDDEHRDIADVDLTRHDDANSSADRPASAGADSADPGEQVQDEAERPKPVDEEPLLETAIPDIREDAVGPPDGVDQDSLHAAATDEVAVAAARAQLVAAELRDREALEARHEADERAQQLSDWHDDEVEIQETAGPADDGSDAEAEDYVDAEV